MSSTPLNIFAATSRTSSNTRNMIGATCNARFFRKKRQENDIPLFRLRFTRPLIVITEAVCTGSPSYGCESCDMSCPADWSVGFMNISV